jgi:AGCS family alanine or glycine:cation symporter
MIAFLETVNRFVWGIPALVLILGVGIFLTVCTGFAQIRLFPRAVRSFLQQFIGKNQTKDGVSPYQALCTALAATVGTGNLAGVAGAIAIGGPGAIFWMWICAILGMVTKFAEAVLAVRYRVRNENGEFVGGPMYMIQQGLGNRWKWMASLYCFFAVVASFGVGNATQINAVIGGINSVLESFGGYETQWGNFLMGMMLAVLLTVLLLGGAKRIGAVAEKLVPFASVGYLLLGAVVLIARAQAIPAAFSTIVQGAFSPKAATGGVLGSAFISLRVGASRGVFTNEAGMGTASIAHGAAEVRHPVEQGFMGIMEVFIDTIVICTLTAFVILCSGVTIRYGTDNGVQLTAQAFSAVMGDWVCIPIALALCCFAIATVLGWGLYGARCAQYLFGDKAWKGFVYVQAVTVMIGAMLGTGTVWMLSETINGLMAIPNLIALAMLSPELIRLVKEYKIMQSTTSGC